MTTTIRSIIVVLGLVSLCAASAAALPAFPGAEGCGSDTPGGRGGRVIAVTTLDDSGPGSLREAVTTKGPRIVVFHVGGTIRLKSHLVINEPFITIAGQTAPGDGILLRDAGLYVQTHDVVIRFIRSRVGPSLVEKFSTQDALQISGDEPYNVVVDHCSFSWSIDECVGIRGPGHDITFSWNIISEALRQPFTKEQIGKDRAHSMAIILGGKPTRVSVHHNLIGHCESRTPRIQGGRHDFVNNVVYDWRWLSGTFSRQPEVNFIGNTYKRGPASRTIKAIVEKPGEMGRIYVRGNRTHERPSDDLPEWDPIVNAPAQEHRATEPFDLVPLTIASAERAYDEVLHGAGATLPRRDVVDRRVVRQVRLSMGGSINRPEEVGGYPKMRSGLVPADTDSDGLPDDWERAQGFDPEDSADGKGDADHDGYTNVEEYLNDLVADGMMPRPEFRYMTYGEPGGPFRVHCGEVNFPVLPAGRDGHLFYTHAWFNGEIDINVTLSEGDIRTAQFMPKRYRDHLEVNDDTLRFRVAAEGHRVIQLGEGPDAPTLVAAFNTYPPPPENDQEPEVIDATRYGVVWGASDVTCKLQMALDACAQLPNGGVVFVATGEHKVGTLRIPSHVILHLARSARLYSNSEITNDAIILFDNVTNAGLAGPGVVDGRGTEHARKASSVRIVNSRSIHIKDIVLRDPAGWGIDVVGSEDVLIERTNVFAVDRRREVGGLRIDGGKNIRCERSFVSSTVSAVSIVADEKGGKVEDVSIRETVLAADKTAVAVGPRTVEPIQNLLFRDIDVVQATSGISLIHRDGGGIEQVVFRDMTMRLVPQEKKSDAGWPFLVVDASRGQKPVRDILFDRVQANAYATSRIQGFGPAWLEDIKFWGVRLTAEPIAAAEPVPALFTLDQVRDPQFRFVTIRWPKQREEFWNPALFSAGKTENVVADPKEIFHLMPDDPDP